MVPRAKSKYKNTKINKKFVLNSQLPTNQILDKKSRSLEQSYFSFIIKKNEIRFSNLPVSHEKYSKKLFWAWNLNNLFTVMGRKIEFQVQNSDMEYLFWLCEKHSALSEKKAPLP